MKEIIRRDAIAPYRETRKASPMPYLAAGFAVLLLGVARPMARILDYAAAAGVALIVYFIARGVWPDRRIRVELPPDTGDAQADQLLAEAREALKTFRAANDRIADPGVSACIEEIERLALRILERLEEQPALHGQLRTFLRYYLPTTRKLLDARAAIEQEGAGGENARLVTARTDRVLPEIQRAFEKQLDALDKHKYLDLQVEMDVLEGMLKSDGLSDIRR